MNVQIHFFDRRDGERRVVEAERKYHWPENGLGRFSWTEHNYACDCNRSTLMYGVGSEKTTNCCDDINLIVVEKIVCEGETVYEEPNAELPPHMVSLLLAREAFHSLTNCIDMPRTADGLAAAVAALKAAGAALSLHPDTEEALGYINDAVERGEKIVATERDITAVLDFEHEWAQVGEDEMDLSDLVREEFHKLPESAATASGGDS
jgi:hypothetical protein